ncbi:chemotaxis protein CheD [Pseudomonas sp. Q1-7]|uniref:chemotaxis protein CheD n=1 Tax=Pseudomonas sp. Q1-7 TaxID=3020843 RepID=UPI002301A46F|nr:chemotaxis protein CheD [Pseudomonas sp. Q1-7]
MISRRFLNPGELHFGKGEVAVETLLGPCIAIVLWYPGARLGGMCHFQLPGTRRVFEHSRDLDGRYGSDAWIWLKQQARVHALKLSEAEVKLFGGARSLAGSAAKPCSDIGRQNIQFVERLMKDAGVRVVGRDLGGEGCRYIRFDLASGEVWVRRGAALMVQPGKEALP